MSLRFINKRISRIRVGSILAVILLSSCLSEIRTADDQTAALAPSPESPNATLSVLSGATIPALGPSATHVVRIKLENTTSKSMAFVSNALGGSNPGAYSIQVGAPCNGANPIPSGSSCMFVITATGGTGCTTCQAEWSLQYVNADGVNQTLSRSFSFSSPTPAQAIVTNRFALPTNRIETIIGNDVPLLQSIDLSGSAAPGGRMLITDEYLLPKGLTFDPALDMVSGFPTKAGIYPVEFCSIQQSMKTNVCKTVIYRIIAPKTLSAVRATATANASCSSSLGTGSSADPILIANGNDLNTCVRNFPRGAFKLTANIDLSAFTNSTFDVLPHFYGQLDGNGFEIQNYTWSHSVANATYNGYEGFFRSLQLNSVVKNLTLRSFSIAGANTTIPGAFVAGTSFTGVLAGASRGGIVYQVQIINSSLTNCRRNCGGFIGGILNPSVPGHNIDSDPASSSEYTDGYLDRLTGTNLTITNPFDAWGFSGGVIGGMYATPFRISRAKIQATISSGNGSAGIVGFHYPQFSASANSNLWLDQCQSTGTITAGAAGGGAMFGGIIGSMDSGSFITNSFSKMTLDSTDQAMGGIAGSVLDSESGANVFALVNTYFNGSLLNGATRGTLIGGAVNYGIKTFSLSNQLFLVQTRTNTSWDTVVSGISTTVVNTNQILSSGADFQLSTNFSSWPSPPWIISNGSDPALADP
jgi:hypothetical protein